MKNVIFKFLAIVVAIGGAITSIHANVSLAAGDAHVKYLLGSSTICSTVAPNACSTTTGPQVCKITVIIDGQGPQSVTAWNHGCSQTKRNSTTTSVGNKTIPAGSVILQ